MLGILFDMGISIGNVRDCYDFGMKGVLGFFGNERY
jgi:hypothetical protein